MKENKTKVTEASVEDYISSIEDEARRKDCEVLAKLMAEASHEQPKMWGSSIVGFGSYHYKYESGHEGDAPLVGFSPRKAEFAIYLTSQFDNREELLKQFGKYKSAKACIYFKKMEDINVDVFKKMISNSLKYYKAKYK